MPAFWMKNVHRSRPGSWSAIVLGCIPLIVCAAGSQAQEYRVRTGTIDGGALYRQQTQRYEMAFDPVRAENYQLFQTGLDAHAFGVITYTAMLGNNDVRITTGLGAGADRVVNNTVHRMHVERPVGETVVANRDQTIFIIPPSSSDRGIAILAEFSERGMHRYNITFHQIYVPGLVVQAGLATIAHEVVDNIVGDVFRLPAGSSRAAIIRLIIVSLLTQEKQLTELENSVERLVELAELVLSASTSASTSREDITFQVSLLSLFLNNIIQYAVRDENEKRTIAPTPRR
jgi:hypothetical protein